MKIENEKVSKKKSLSVEFLLENPSCENSQWTTMDFVKGGQTKLHLRPANKMDQHVPQR